ncbi:MAG: helix-turn-helix transcriptional regulator [Bacteroidia bacterium]|nr:helix-turn-helix transcriptional regulator [Bacteroidia bacterium]
MDKLGTSTVLQIRNMVSSRCISLVQNVLDNTPNIQVEKVYLGAAQIIKTSGNVDFIDLQKQLQAHGFDLIYDKEMALLEAIKVAVLEMIYYGNNLNTIIRNSDYLSDKLGHPYSYLSKLFSEKTNTTLEKFIILVKIERVKELLSYNEMTLSEISYQMGYSSVQYLSNQFKQITTYSVSEYKALQIKPRTPLDQLI